MAPIARDKWLLRRPDPDAELRLFLLPYSGCGASMYHRWPRFLGPVETCPVQLPGRENRLRERHYGTYETLAEDLAEALTPYLDRPFAFFGHCGGALPAAEVTVRLDETGLPTPSHLFVSSQVAPQDGPFGRFLAMDEAELRDTVRALASALGGRVDDSLLDMAVELLAADIEANKRYSWPAPKKLPCTITTMSWSGDSEVPGALMGGWTACSDRVRHVELDGGHYEFLNAPAGLRDLIHEAMPAPSW